MTKTATKNNRRSSRKTGGWKANPPNPGQWKRSKSKDDETGIGFVTVSVKMRPEEREQFRRTCNKLKITPNRAMRSFARRSAGFLEINDEALGKLATITRQISGVSTNINQIAKAGNRTQSPDYIAFMKERRKLGLKLAELEDIIREIVNVARRRSDGLRKLSEVLDR